MGFPKAEPVLITRSFQERRNLHPRDLLLRWHGFRVHSRPRGKPAIWERGGNFYTEADAVAMCEKAKRQEASKS